jgi:hypothetical protein
MATMCEGGSLLLNERRATATKSAIVALEIHNILDERAAVVSEEGRFEALWRVRIADVPIATYISASAGVLSKFFTKRKRQVLYRNLFPTKDLCRLYGPIFNCK